MRLYRSAEIFRIGLSEPEICLPGRAGHSPRQADEQERKTAEAGKVHADAERYKRKRTEIQVNERSLFRTEIYGR